MVRASFGVVAVVVAAWAMGCTTSAPSSKPDAQRKTRAAPVCAVQDCTTGKIIDDGCAADGRCTSCVNACAK